MNDLRPRFHGQFYFDKVGLSQKNMLLWRSFNVKYLCDKGERAKQSLVSTDNFFFFFFFDKVGLSQKIMLVSTQFCGEVALSNICKG